MDLEIEIEKNKVTVYDGPYVSDGRVTPDGLAFAKEVLAMSEEAKSVAADEFLETYNSTWTGGGYKKLTRKEFVKNLSFSRVKISDEIGAGSIFYHDGGMFGGHWIIVSIQDKKPAWASMYG